MKSKKFKIKKAFWFFFMSIYLMLVALCSQQTKYP